MAGDTNNILKYFESDFDNGSWTSSTFVYGFNLRSSFIGFWSFLSYAFMRATWFHCTIWLLLFNVNFQSPTQSTYIIIKFATLVLKLTTFLLIGFPPEALYYRWVNEMLHLNFMTVWSNRLLNANKINCLRVDAFQDLHNLNLLSLYDNKLQTVAKGTFSALRAIQTMYVCTIWTGIMMITFTVNVRVES